MASGPDPIVQLEQFERDAATAFGQASTVDALEQARVEHLGRSAPLVGLLRTLRDLPAEQRSQVGAAANAVRQRLEAAHVERKERFERAEIDERLERERSDVSLPAWPMPRGSLHPLTQTRRTIEDIFIGMGYRIADGPEIEDEFHNFTALNTPEGHPARSESDTFYIRPGVLLRTQTSPVQVRVMQSQPPPVYVISPGRVYRRDRIDATHAAMFHQIEGLAVDENLTLADLQGTLQQLCRALFGPDRKIRMRTHFFPFTEPSVEVDMSCHCRDADDRADANCRVCRGAGWIELLGAGMIDPNVFEAVGYDPETVRGFAFGLGVDRAAMLRYSVPDLRLFVENDLRFLRQFPATAVAL